MVRINFDVEDLTYIEFKQKVGAGNVATTLRNYVKSCTGDSDKEWVLKRKLEKVKEQKDIIDKEYKDITNKLNLMEQKKVNDEEKKIKFMEEQRDRFKKAKGQMMKDHLNRVLD